MRQDPHLGIAGMLQRKGNPIHLVPVPLQKLPEECQFDQIRLRSFTSVFSFGVDSLRLSYPLGDHKALVLFDPYLEVLHVCGQTSTESL